MTAPYCKGLDPAPSALDAAADRIEAECWCFSGNRTQTARAS